MKIVMSSGHGMKIRGASGYIDEVDEARRVVDETARVLSKMDVDVTLFHDDVSTTQSENLNRIVNFHNSKARELDVSVHFNAYQTTSKAMGSEVLYVSNAGLEYAKDVVASLCGAVGFINRGPKKRTDLAFLNNTDETAILIEVCFVDSKADVDLYDARFNDVCASIASGIAGQLPAKPAKPPGYEGWRENITATVFSGSGDPQESAYPPYPHQINPNKPGASVPYKWRDEPPPDLVVSGPKGEEQVPTVDVGPWNTDDPAYVLDGHRPLSETQYKNKTKAQNGMVPSNDAGIDLTPATAKAIGIDGKGKVSWRFADADAVPETSLESRVKVLEDQVADLITRVEKLEEMI